MVAPRSRLCRAYESRLEDTDALLQPTTPVNPLSLALWGLIASASGLLCTWAARALATRAGIVNQPNPHVPQHRRPVAYLGGAGIGAGIVLAWVLGALLARSADGGGLLESVAAVEIGAWWRLVLPAALFLGLGVWDDLRVFSPRAKFAFQVCIAVLTVLLGCRVELTGWTLLDGAVSVFLIVSFVNAFNMTDVCDGLVALLAMAGFVWAAVLGADAVLMMGFTGATLGFWLLNRPDASIFLGDAGTHLLGFLAAVSLLDPALGVVAYRSAWMAAIEPASSVWSTVWVWWAALSCFGLPLFELIFLIAVRSRRGAPVYMGSSDHYSLRLQAAGLSKWATLGVSLALAMVLGCSGWVVLHGGTFVRALTVIATALVLVTFGLLLVRWDATPRPSHERTP